MRKYNADAVSDCKIIPISSHPRHQANNGSTRDGSTRDGSIQVCKTCGNDYTWTWIAGTVRGDRAENCNACWFDLEYPLNPSLLGGRTRRGSREPGLSGLPAYSIFPVPGA